MEISEIPLGQLCIFTTHAGTVFYGTAQERVDEGHIKVDVFSTGYVMSVPTHHIREVITHERKELQHV